MNNAPIKSGLRRVGSACSAVFYHPITRVAFDLTGAGLFGYNAYANASHHQMAYAALGGFIALMWASRLPQDLRRLQIWGSQHKPFSGRSLS